MIKIKDGALHIEGTRMELTTEFMCIINSLLEKGIISKEHMMHITSVACIPANELKQMVLDAIDNMDDIGMALHLLGELERWEN